MRDKMQKIAEKVKRDIPADHGFVVLVFPFGESEDGRLNYVSNAQRGDVVNAMLEFIAKTDGNWNKHIENH